MKVYIRTFTGYGRRYELDVDQSATFKELKNLLSRKPEFSGNDNLQRMNFVWDEEIVDDENKDLIGFTVRNESELALVDLNIDGRNLADLGIPFIDVSDEKGLKKRKLGKNGPRWRIIGKGLNLKGTCNNSACAAYNQLVNMKMGYISFDLANDPSGETTVCPMPNCRKYVEPVSCGFYKCWWRFKGIKTDKSIKGQPPVSCSCDWKDATDGYYRFDGEDGGTVTWRQLVIEAIKEKPH